MDKEDKQFKILIKMSFNEELLGELYKKFARKFGEYSKFWQNISNEELKHAAWIRRIADEMLEGRVTFNENKLIIKGINNFTDQIQESIKKADESDFNELKAISTSRILESSLLEYKCFDVVKTNTQYLKELLNNLRLDTKRHLKTIEEKWEKVRKEKGIKDL